MVGQAVNKYVNYVALYQSSYMHGGKEVRFIRKDQSRLMRVISYFFPANRMFWTTVRFPFGGPRVYYPEYVGDPHDHGMIVHHEMVHVDQQKTAWGLFKTFWLAWLLPLPIGFSGRWFIERDAFLGDIKRLGGTDLAIAAAVSDLHSGYLWPWPRKLMYAWFKKQLNSGAQSSVTHMTG